MSTQFHPSLSSLAEQIATEAHQGQFRRCGQRPYIVHPRAVASRIDDDDEAQAVAWLHDVLEDTPFTAQTLLERGIPASVIKEVQLLTKKPGQSYQDYLTAVAASPIATKVKIADMLSNLADNPTTRQIRKYATGLLHLTPNDP